MASMGTEILVFDGINEELLRSSAAPLATLAGGGRFHRHGDKSIVTGRTSLAHATVDSIVTCRTGLANTILANSSSAMFAKMNGQRVCGAVYFPLMATHSALSFPPEPFPRVKDSLS